MIDILVQKKYGLSHTELSRAVTGKDKPSGSLMRVLENLERSELIERRAMFLNRSKHARLFVDPAAAR